MVFSLIGYDSEGHLILSKRSYRQVKEDKLKTKKVSGKQVTSLQPESKLKLLHLISKLAPYTETPAIGRWKTLTHEEIWSHIVSQVCVMGSSRPMETLVKSGNRHEFNAALSLSALSKTKPDKVAYIESQLIQFKATRFRNKAALRLAAAFVNPNIINGTNVVLLNNLPNGDTDMIREELLKRSVGLFKRKSVSDLMIALGLSHDVIALDQRVVGILNNRFQYDQKFSKLQADRELYLSVEDCLREVCEEAKISLGTLDRMLFGFSGLTAIEYVMDFDQSISAPLP